MAGLLLPGGGATAFRRSSRRRAWCAARVQASSVLVCTRISTPQRVVHARRPRVCPGRWRPTTAPPARAARWPCVRYGAWQWLPAWLGGGRRMRRARVRPMRGSPARAGAAAVPIALLGEPARAGGSAPQASRPISARAALSPPGPTYPAMPGCGPRSAGGSTAGPSRRACRRCPWPPPRAAARRGSGRPGGPGR